MSFLLEKLKEFVRESLIQPNPRTVSDQALKKKNIIYYHQIN